MELHVKGELNRHGGFSAAFDLTVPLAGVTAVLGPSGAGKSTLLRCIAGLERDSKVAVRLGDERWQDEHTFLPPHLRPVSMVFQDGRLFPHLTVRQNLMFPLEQRTRSGARLSLDTVIETMALEALIDRRPATLSGGQRQRVALARALLTPARLWLFDEPMSSLDGTARREIGPYLARACRDHRVPVLYVTHALDEVHHLASRILVLNEGRVIANQSIDAVGKLTPVGEHAYGGAVLRGRALGYSSEYDLTELGIGRHRLVITGRIEKDSEVSVLVAARDVSIALQDVANVSIQNRLPASIVSITDEPSGSCLITLDCEGQQLASRITRRSAHQLELAPGRSVVALIKSVALAGAAP